MKRLASLLLSLLLGLTALAAPPQALCCDGKPDPPPITEPQNPDCPKKPEKPEKPGGGERPMDDMPGFGVEAL